METFSIHIMEIKGLKIFSLCLNVVARESNCCSIILVVREQNKRGSHQGKMFILKLEVSPIWEKCLLLFGVRRKTRTRKTNTIRRATRRTASRTTTRKTIHPVDSESSEEEDPPGNQAVSEDLQGAGCVELLPKHVCF